MFRLILFTLLTTKSAFAYLDPGFFSLVFQSIVAGFAAVMLFSKNLTNSFKLFIKKIFKKK